MNPAPLAKATGLGIVDRHPADDSRSNTLHALSPQAQAARRENSRRRLAAQVHALGPAPMLHLLLEVASGADLDERLERYAGLPGDFISELGGRDFPVPMFAVAGGRCA